MKSSEVIRAKGCPTLPAACTAHLVVLTLDWRQQQPQAAVPQPRLAYEEHNPAPDAATDASQQQSPLPSRCSSLPLAAPRCSSHVPPTRDWRQQKPRATASQPRLAPEKLIPAPEAATDASQQQSLVPHTRSPQSHEPPEPAGAAWRNRRVRVKNPRMGPELNALVPYFNLRRTCLPNHFRVESPRQDQHVSKVWTIMRFSGSKLFIGRALI